MNVTFKQLRKIPVAFFAAILGWPVYALTYFMPRNTAKYVFGVFAASLSGNIRVLYLDEQFASGSVKVLLYRDKKVKMMLDSMPDSERHLYYSVFSIRGIFHALTAKYYVYSNYLSGISFWLSSGAVVFNVWHGTPLKTIERDVRIGVYAKKNRWQHILKFVFPHFFVRPDKMLVCSEYEKTCFKTAFDISDESTFVFSFPPRLNDVERQRSTCEKDTILYCPTWRDDGYFLFQDEVDVIQLNQLMSEMNLIFVIKPHPSDRSLHLSGTYSNVILESNLADIYDILPKSVVLITDYSSMLFDAVYCGIPTMLFCPDLQHYQNENRGFYTSIQSLGLTVAINENELFENILNVKKLKSSNDIKEYFAVYKNKSVNL